MRTTRRAVTAAMTVTAAMVLAGCAGEDDLPREEAPGVPDDATDGDDSDDSDDSDDAGEGGAADGDPAAGSDAALGDETMTAIDELVAGGVDRDAVLVREAEFVTWSDGALGCPDADMMYTQALVEGYRIVLDVDGEEVVFHGAEGEEPFRCDDPQPPVDR